VKNWLMDLIKNKKITKEAVLDLTKEKRSDTIEKARERQIKALSNSNLAEMITELELQGKGLPEKFGERVQEVKKIVDSDRKVGEDMLKKFLPNHSMLQLDKIFKGLEKKAAKEQSLADFARKVITQEQEPSSILRFLELRSSLISKQQFQEELKELNAVLSDTAARMVAKNFMNFLSEKDVLIDDAAALKDAWDKFIAITGMEDQADLIVEYLGEPFKETIKSVAFQKKETHYKDTDLDQIAEELLEEGVSEEAADEYVKDIYLPSKEFNKQLTSSWIKSYDVVERGDNYTIIEPVDGKPEIEYEKGKDVYHGWVDEIVNDVFIIKGDDGLPDEAYDLLEKYMKKNYSHLKSFGDITNVSSKRTKSSEDEIDIFVDVLKPSGDLLKKLREEDLDGPIKKVASSWSDLANEVDFGDDVSKEDFKDWAESLALQIYLFVKNNGKAKIKNWIEDTLNLENLSTDKAYQIMIDALKGVSEKEIEEFEKEASVQFGKDWKYVGGDEDQNKSYSVYYNNKINKVREEADYSDGEYKVEDMDVDEVIDTHLYPKHIMDRLNKEISKKEKGASQKKEATEPLYDEVKKDVKKAHPNMTEKEVDKETRRLLRKHFLGKGLETEDVAMETLEYAQASQKKEAQKFEEGDIVLFDNSFYLILTVGSTYYNMFDLLAEGKYNDIDIDRERVDSEAQKFDIEGAKEFLATHGENPSLIDKGLDAASIYKGEIWKKDKGTEALRKAFQKKEADEGTPFGGDTEVDTDFGAEVPLDEAWENISLSPVKYVLGVAAQVYEQQGSALTPERLKEAIEEDAGVRVSLDEVVRYLKKVKNQTMAFKKAQEKLDVSQAIHHLDYFLQDGKVYHLDEAKEIVETNNIVPKDIDTAIDLYNEGKDSGEIRKYVEKAIDDLKELQGMKISQKKVAQKFEEGDIVLFDNSFYLILTVGSTHYNMFDLLAGEGNYNDEDIDRERVDSQAEKYDVEGAKEFLETHGENPNEIDKGLAAASIYKGQIWKKDKGTEQLRRAALDIKFPEGMDKDILFEEVKKYAEYLSNGEIRNVDVYFDDDRKNTIVVSFDYQAEKEEIPAIIKDNFEEELIVEKGYDVGLDVRLITPEVQKETSLEEGKIYSERVVCEMCNTSHTATDLEVNANNNYVCECGAEIEAIPHQHTFSKKIETRLQHEEWNLINDAVLDVVNNFEKITGVKGWKVIDPEGQFHQEVVNKTYPVIREYLEEKHPEVAEDREMSEKFLYELDDALMEAYADEALEMSQKESVLHKEAYIQEVPGHKCSDDRECPWVIKDHKTHEILFSFPTKEEAKEQLGRMHAFSRRGPGSSQRPGQPKSDIERVMTHYRVNENEAKEMLKWKSADELLPQRGQAIKETIEE